MFLNSSWKSYVLIFLVSSGIELHIFDAAYLHYLKVAEHSFQELIPNSPLLLSYLSFGARFLQDSRLTTEEFILAFWLRSFAHYELTLNPFCQHCFNEILT